MLEAREADLHLHVIDAADPERTERIAQVNEVLASIDADGIAQLQIYNKVDLLGEEPRVERDEQGLVCRIWLSAATGQGLELLREALIERFGSRLARVVLALSPAQGRARAVLYQRGAVLREDPAENGGWLVEVECAEADLVEFCRREGLTVPITGAGSGSAPCLATEGFLQSGL